ncbi:MAG: ABC transporter ATP-binding protein [Verrucomicrobia bacterium]|nr:ABC transporter ATP-binding protein [Verrucomicrobiota bacterium]MDA1087322.1 ABC transporter ATP-binding protein [Verrucomicrobiota bacterium]
MSRRKKRLDATVEELLGDVDILEGSARRDLRRLWSDYMNTHRKNILVTAVASIVWGGAPQFFAVTNRFLVDRVLRVQQPYNTATIPEQSYLLIIWLFIVLGLWGAYLLSNYCRFWFILTASRDTVYRIRRDMNDKMHALHIGFYDRMPTGRIISRVITDVDTLRGWLDTELTNALGFLARVVIGIVLAVIIEPRMGLVILAFLPAYVLCFYVMQPRIRRVSIAMSRLMSRIYGRISERIAGVAVVKTFAAEPFEMKAFAHLQHNNVRIALRTARYVQILELIAGVITACATGAIVFFGAGMVKTGETSLGTLVALLSILGLIFQPLGQLTSQATGLQGFLVALRRVFSVLDTEVEQRPGLLSLQGMKGRIEFENVTFFFPGHDAPIISNLSLSIMHGQKVAIMGPSGSGKSTLFQLLMRFYDPSEGSIRIGGVDMREADSRSLRRHVCLVQQEPVIFSGTLADNIGYGNEDATPAQIIRSARLADMHDFIMTLPVKYETEVGENGIALSGGQRQRLALATALLTEPEILLLDDTTSALDARTEAQIRATLWKVLEDRTGIIITQRISTARKCDRIVVLDHGRVESEGTHEQLMKTCQFYQRIDAQQNLSDS